MSSSRSGSRRPMDIKGVSLAFTAMRQWIQELHVRKMILTVNLMFSRKATKELVSKPLINFEFMTSQIICEIFSTKVMLKFGRWEFRPA